MVIVDVWDRCCIMGRAPRTKETLPDFYEWCRVTRHPRVFHGLTGCQRTPRVWGVTFSVDQLDVIYSGSDRSSTASSRLLMLTS